MPDAANLLARHFFRRFIENDLISPDADRHQTLAVACACIVSFGLVVTMLIALKYLAGVPIPGQTALMSLDDKFLYIGWSMLVMGLVALAEWDALALDARDASILGPLPIPGGVIFRAKATALLLFAGACAVVLNIVPSIIFSSALVAKVVVGPVAYLTLIGTHALTTLTAGAFGFLSVLAIRELLHALLGTARFRRVSAVLQAALVVFFVTTLCLMPGVSNRIGSVHTAPERISYAMPPLWFLGLYETAAGHVLDDLPRTGVPRRLLAAETRATEIYRSRRAAFHQLASIALAALALVTLVAAAAYSVNNRQLPSPVSPSQDLPHRVRRCLVRLSERWIVRRPLMRAGFFFTLQTLSRSGAHRLTMAIATAIGLALTTVALQGVDVRGALENPRVMTGLLAVQQTVVLVLLMAFRHSARVPSDLAANWAFQMAWAGDPHSYIAGVKRAAFVAVVCPALLVLLPVHLALLGFWTAGVHAVCGLFIGIAALETLMLGFRTLPFASGYVAGGNLKAWVPACIIGFWPLTHVLGGIERLAMGDAGAISAFVASLMLFSAGVRTLGGRQRRSYGPIEFYELPAQAQRLNLGA